MMAEMKKHTRLFPLGPYRHQNTKTAVLSDFVQIVSNWSQSQERNQCEYGNGLWQHSHGKPQRLIFKSNKSHSLLSKYVLQLVQCTGLKIEQEGRKHVVRDKHS